jgi:hypothetical protein
LVEIRLFIGLWVWKCGIVIASLIGVCHKMICIMIETNVNEYGIKVRGRNTLYNRILFQSKDRTNYVVFPKPVGHLCFPKILGHK